MNEKREMLRHCTATLAYRAAKVFRDAPEEVATFRIGNSSRTPSEIVAHLIDLIEWATSLAEGKEYWASTPPQSMKNGEAAFFTALAKFDSVLMSGVELACSEEKLFQGPIADAFTHVGQISMIRRCAEAPVRGENYFVADIVTGRVSQDQSPPKREFD